MLTGVIDNTDRPILFTVNKGDFLFTFMSDSIYEMGCPSDPIVLPNTDGYIFGRTHDNHRIAIYAGDECIKVHQTQKLNTGSYIVSKGNIMNRDFNDFVGISFVGGSLSNIFRADRLDFDSGKLEARIKNDYMSYEIDIDGEIIKISIESGISISHDRSGSSLKNSDVTLTMTFDTPKKLNDIIKYYSAIKKTLSFMCFRKNVGFDRIYLLKDSEQFAGLKDSFGEVFIRDERDIALKDWQINICVADLKDSFPNLIKLFLDDKSSLAPIISFLPENDKDLYFISPSKVKELCSALEAEYTFTTKEKRENDELLSSIKKTVRDDLSNFKKANPDFPDSSYNSLVSSVENWSLSLRDRITYLRNKYAEELSLVNDSNINIDENSIKGLVKYRNDVTHRGTALLASPVTEIAFYIQSIVYFSVLERIGVPREEIKGLCRYRLLR